MGIPFEDYDFSDFSTDYVTSYEKYDVLTIATVLKSVTFYIKTKN